jgi:hypothetical protein
VPGGLEKRKGNGGREADIRGCCEASAHAWLGPCIAQRLGDPRVVRHRQKWLYAGVLEAGQWHAQEEGPPPGGRVSPVAAPSSRHDVLALWADRGRRPDARGEVIIVRSADECLVGGAHRDAAARFWSALRDRRGQGTLARHPEQTRLSECGRFAVERRQRRAPGQPETVAGLGLTPSRRQTRHGKCPVRRKTIAQRLRQHLQAVQDTRRRRMPWPIPQQGAWRKRVLLGQDRSSAVPRHGSLRRVCRDTIMR